MVTQGMQQAERCTARIPVWKGHEARLPGAQPADSHQLPTPPGHASAFKPDCTRTLLRGAQSNFRARLWSKGPAFLPSTGLLSKVGYAQDNLPRNNPPPHPD